MTVRNAVTLAIVIALIAGAIWYLESLKPKTVSVDRNENSVEHATTTETADYAVRVKNFPLAQELVAPDGYLNTGDKPITIASLVGKKVILVDFWTYSCINCQRTQPYLNAWYEKYADEGLEIIGVHTPEFDFEKVKENVAQAVARDGIKYPVVQDNAYATWNAYQNRFWPHKYLIDINGLIVYDHIGEGAYDETEREIQKALAERKQVLGEAGSISTGIVAPSETPRAGSAETYFGYDRNEFLGNGRAGSAGMQTLTRPEKVLPNVLYMTGAWNFTKEYAESASASSIIYSYDAKQVFFVAESTEGTTITVLRDGVPVAAEKGADVDASGRVLVKEARLYKLINEKERGTHTIEIKVEGAGLKAFTFTFG
ncbi:MAG: hypothetical protein AB199_01630 [Parcubacteria bacterium C7867-004]|nr:MAG: hypothetical protein AB199_01630 [Parcubacteria bacterium C7867-004]